MFARVEVLLSVFRLVDRYAVEGYEYLLASEFDACMMWGKTLATVVANCYRFPQASLYQKAILGACKDIAMDSSFALQDLRKNFERAMRCLTRMDPNYNSTLRAKMQLLCWVQELVNSEWAALSDKDWAIFELIPKELQGLIDKLGDNSASAGRSPSTKRQRLT